MRYKLVIQPEVFEDIQQGINWYNSRQKGLGLTLNEKPRLHSQPGFYYILRYYGLPNK